MGVFASALRLLNRDPVLWRGRRVQIVYYGLFAGLDAVAVGVFMSYFWYLRGAGLPRRLIVISPLVIVFVIAASRMVDVLRYWKHAENPVRLFYRTGLRVDGGIVAAIISGLIVSAYTGIDVPVLFDGVAWGFLIGQCFGRLGCFNYGCCYGRPTGSRNGIAYTNRQSRVLRIHPELHGVRLHPVQLYTALVNLCGFVVASVLVAANPPPGVLAGGVLVFHGGARLLLERFRYDIYEGGKGRNWIAFRFSVVAVVAGLSIVAAALVHGSSMPWPAPCDVSIAGLAQIIAENLGYFIPLCLTAFTVVFVTLGIRGKEIAFPPALGGGNAAPS